jgi:hypothetical protein
MANFSSVHHRYLLGYRTIRNRLYVDVCLVFSGFTMFCVGMAINIHSGTLIKKDLIEEVKVL